MKGREFAERVGAVFVLVMLLLAISGGMAKGEALQAKFYVIRTDGNCAILGEFADHTRLGYQVSDNLVAKFGLSNDTWAVKPTDATLAPGVPPASAAKLVRPHPLAPNTKFYIKSVDFVLFTQYLAAASHITVKVGAQTHTINTLGVYSAVEELVQCLKNGNQKPSAWFEPEEHPLGYGVAHVI